jgi:ATP-dependent Clp protease ATP-binding subunit ClpB
MKDVAVRLAERGVALAVTDAALDVILSLSYDPVCASFKYHRSILSFYSSNSESHNVFVAQQVYGARPIRRWIEKRIVTELSKMLIREEIDENSTVYVDASLGKEELTYRVDKNGGVVNAQTGQKSDILIQVPNGAVGSDATQAVKRMKIAQDGGDVDDMEEE